MYQLFKIDAVVFHLIYCYAGGAVFLCPAVNFYGFSSSTILN